MTVSEWIKENKKWAKYIELTIVDENNVIILDDKIAYLQDRSKEYNKGWKAKCRGKKIVNQWESPRGRVLQIA